MRRLVLVLCLVAGGLLVPAQPAHAAAYAMTTSASYDVLPDEGRVNVRVDVTFTNTTPNPTGRFSVFDEIKLAVQDGAAGVDALDDEGDLTASMAVENGVNVATVRLREGVRYQKTAKLTVTYHLPDGGASGLRVRPSAIIFPAWSFGTAGLVTVWVPSAYEVRTDGDPLTAANSQGRITLTSGEVADPTQWLSLVVATTTEAAYVTTSRFVPLEGGTVDLQVRAFDDDPEWGESTADLLADALPPLQQTLGLEWSRQGPVVVSEVVEFDASDGLDEAGGSSPELVVGFDQSGFTIVHQAAHLWITDQVASDRWIREGLASWAAGTVSERLDLDPPYDPAARLVDLGEAAFPLESWGAGDASAEQDAYGYAAAWALCNDLADRIGDDAVHSALRRILAGRSAYDRVSAEEPDPGAVPVRPVDSRRFLDHLEQVSEVDLAPLFAERVFADEAAAEVASRGEAREAYTQLLGRAGDWGAPRTVTAPLAAWDFVAAEAAIDDADAWLEDRDALLESIGHAGLTTPGRLRDRYAEFGGGQEAEAEVEAEHEVVDAYQAALDASTRGRGIVERIGLLAGPDVSSMLVRAHGAFAQGDLDTALTESQRAQTAIDGAGTAGLVRLLSAAVLLIIGIGTAIWLLRRRRAAAPTPLE